ncbi:LPS export ABC transporter periplasmic protein LptC [Arhodomonas sp. AD133]|uniref:LPS export ABC transporter periplasmic protein LptC n=1 Tax=Arhodomonas sp. AD133 TaxID=3415009 RepID=UPI003EB8C496
MRESNRAAFPLVALALMVALVWLSFGGERERADSGPPVREPQARYYATDVTLSATDDTGRPYYELTAPRAAYFPNEARWRIEAPRWHSLGARADWQGDAENAVVADLADGTQSVVLRGDVRLQRTSPHPLTLETPRLTLEPARHYAETDAAVTLRGPHSELRGQGARAWLDDERVELLANVRGRYASD